MMYSPDLPHRAKSQTAGAASGYVSADRPVDHRAREVVHAPPTAVTVAVREEYIHARSIFLKCNP
jgi:hypothetical protein